MAIQFRDLEMYPPNQWEMDTHDYRVVLWRQQDPDPGFTKEQMGWRALIYDLRAEDVHEVINWAESKVGADEIYTLYVRFEDSPDGETGLLHIAGADPTHAPDDHSYEFHRRHPVRD